MLLSAVAAPAARQAGVTQMPAPLGPPDVLPGTPVPLPEAPPDIVWTVPIAAAPITSPLIASGHVLITHLPGIVAAHRAVDGERVWQTELSPEQPLAADGGNVFVVAGEAIHALRIIDGSVAWRAPTGTLTAPLLAKDGWVIASSGAKLKALRASDGTEVWTVEAPLQREASGISGDVLFVPSVDGRLRAIDLPTGRTTWERRIGGAPGEPLIVGDDLFVGASDRRFYSLDAVTGEERWTVSRIGAAILGRPSSDGERVFFAAVDNMIRAHDLDNGAQKWHAGLNFRPLGGPVTAGGSLVVTGPGTEIRLLRTADGRPAGSVSLPAKLAIAPGFAASDHGVEIAAITGGLEESWSLSLTRPVRALPLSAPLPK